MGTKNFKFSFKILVLLKYILCLCVLANVAYSKEHYNKKDIGNFIPNVKASAFDFPPFLNIKKENNGNYTYDGMCFEVLQIMADQLNLKFNYVPVDSKEVSKYGLIVALLNQLARNEVDFAPYFFEMVPDNLKYMDLMLYPNYVGQISLLQPWPDEESRLKVIIRPFDTWVWIGCCLSSLIFIGVTSFFIYFQMKPSGSLGNLVYFQAEYVLTIITGQGNSIRYDSPISYRVLVAPWLLVMVVIIYAYTGVLTSILAVPKFEPPVESVEELVTRGNLRLTLEKKVVFTEDFLGSTSGYKKEIGDSFRADSSLLFSDVFQMIQNVLHRRCAYLGAEEIAFSAVSEDLKANKKCRMTTSSKPMNFFMPYIFGIAKNQLFLKRDLVQFISMQMAASGLVGHLRSKYFSTTNQCKIQQDGTSTEIKSLTLVELVISFVILGVGLSISCLAFIIEHTYKKANIRK